MSYISVIVNQHGTYGALLSLMSKCINEQRKQTHLKTNKQKRSKKNIRLFILPVFPNNWNKLCVTGNYRYHFISYPLDINVHGSADLFK